MASKTGICTNAAGCTLAYTKQPVTIADGGEFRCPECGLDLQEAQGAGGGGGGGGKSSPIGLIIAVVVGLVVVGAAGTVYVPKMLSKKPAEEKVTPEKDGTTEKQENTEKPVIPEKTLTPEPPVTPEKPLVPEKPIVPERPLTPEKPVAPEKPLTIEKPTPPEQPATPPPVPPAREVEKLALVENKEENADVKKQVLQRIDLMPDLSAANRSALTTAVERARGMYKLSIINFESGGITPSSAAIGQLVEGLGSPDVKKLLGDPTAVIIILGYADTKGDPKANLSISQRRAASLAKALGNQGKIKNAMHAVGMGSSEMFGEKQREKNRVVEIWAVLP